MLHDIGKLDVSRKILNKTTALSDDEFTLIRHHPEWGYLRLINTKDSNLNMKAIADIAYQHHEHLDGHGYPNHLVEDQISEFARIVAITDVYDALTTQRPYKKAYSTYLHYHFWHIWMVTANYRLLLLAIR